MEDKVRLTDAMKWEQETWDPTHHTVHIVALGLGDFFKDQKNILMVLAVTPKYFN